MPELPEVEHLRRSLEPWLVGARLRTVRVRRRSVVKSRGDAPLERALLADSVVRALHRHGKQMAIEAEDGRVLVVQLGMTGSMSIDQGRAPSGMQARHRHVLWALEASSPPCDAPPSAAPRPIEGPWTLAFRDPRRFGGLTPYATLHDLRTAWSQLGPDALGIRSRALAANLLRTGRPIKAALLDQSVIAGVGNIYADEALFKSRINPLRPANRLQATEVTRLAGALRTILSKAAAAGGSTLQDYFDALGNPGSAVQLHAVYGRAGQPCVACGLPLSSCLVTARTTTFCAHCQDLST
ncbi:MAG: bifunctional DNA-formamidopyrimidine glycosylase/DNA-(apurinic or apyrimidinic site) lyase [Phycisphaera sp.]|nr:bifunctional DNA-formamidopyrimidine glycosylase/DNA-(apurinic or apyrimidinic site) lyase [Phycisphaera sp.]